MKFFTVTLAICALFAFIAIRAMANNTKTHETTYQGKTITWWAHHAVRARKDANSRAQIIQHLETVATQSRLRENAQNNTIIRLKKVIRYNPSIEECVKLATIAYPDFTEARAWQIIYHESWTSGKQYAKNPSSTASGLYQFLTSTFDSTPYGRAGMSIWSPCASSLAAGWMHQNGRGGEWAIG